MLRRVGTHQVVVGMCKIGLEADHIRHADGFEQIQHVAPRVHACPADFALGGQPLAVTRSDAAGLAEGLGDAGRVARWIHGPALRAVRRVDAHNTPTPHAVFAQHPRNAAGAVHRGEKAARRGPIGHRTTADGLGPDRCHHRADLEVPRGDVVGEATNGPLVSVNVEVGFVQEQIHPSKLRPCAPARWVRSSIRSSEIGDWSVPVSFPTRPGHIALCSFQRWLIFESGPGGIRARRALPDRCGRSRHP